MNENMKKFKNWWLIGNDESQELPLIWRNHGAVNGQKYWRLFDVLRNALFEKIRSEILDLSSSSRNSEFFGIKEGFETSNWKLSKVREQKNFKITKTKLREVVSDKVFTEKVE